MKTLKFLQRFFFLLFVGFTLCVVLACGDDEDDGGSIPSGLVGDWYGYTSKRSVYVTFNSNGTGTLEMSYEGPSGWWKEANAAFSYTVSGSSVKCKGKKTEIDADGKVLNESFSTTFTYSGSKLSGGGYYDITNYQKY